jgi:endoglucanase
MKYSKKIVSLTTLTLLLCCLSIMATKAQVVQKYGWLQVKGTQLCNEDGDSIVLRGMSFGWHCFHPRFYNAEAVRWLHRDWHCNIVRAAMGIEPNGGYLQDSAFAIQKIEAVVDAAIKEGIYVIVDWHSHNVNTKQAARFFDYISRKYGQYPNVIYELFNEPDEESWAEVKQYATTIIPIIRKNAPKNIILVGCPHWDQDINLPAADPILNQQNIMYTAHYYAATHKQELRDRIAKAIMKNHLPVFISESAGMEATGDGPLNEEEWGKWISFSEKFKLSWITWSVSDKNESCSVLLPSASSIGNWTGDDLKLSGKKVRDYIRNWNKVYY